jgi:hypothetical protein
MHAQKVFRDPSHSVGYVVDQGNLVKGIGRSNLSSPESVNVLNMLTHQSESMHNHRDHLARDKEKKNSSRQPILSNSHSD